MMFPMRNEKKHIILDAYEEGAIIKALNEMRTREISEGNYTDVEDELLLKIINAPTRKARIRDEAR